MDKIAVLIPCYNEEKTIGKVVEDAKKVLPEAVIYVYDNNSTDKTAEAAKQAGADIDDLFALTENWPTEAFLDYCHFTDESNETLGAAVTEFLRGQLKK